jgi:hypothetical protein
VRAELAEVLLALHGPRNTFSQLASLASAWLREAAGNQAEILTLEAMSRDNEVGR